MAKRIFQGKDNNFNSKKYKTDFDNFRAPASTNGSKPQNGGPQFSGPQFKNNQSKNQQNAKTAPIRKITRPAQVSIVDKDCFLLDDDDDDVLLIASQQEEERDRVNRQPVTMTDNLTYGGFTNNAPSTSSTQHHPLVETKTGYTENIRNNLFGDDTMRNGAYSQSSSQKENFSSTQRALVEHQKVIKELQQKVALMTTQQNELTEKVMAREGEAKNLRLSKKAVEDQLKRMRMEKLEASTTIKFDPEKDELRKKIEALRAQIDLTQINNFPRHNTSILEPPALPAPEVILDVSHTQFFTNISTTSLAVPMMMPVMFEGDETLPAPSESLKDARERASVEDVINVQLKLAQVHARIVSGGGQLSDATIDELFKDASFLIFRIEDYIEYMENEEESSYAVDNNPALTAAAHISTPDLREKLTKINLMSETLNKNEKLSTFQADKLFPEELCAKPRRIIAFYASLAKYSRKFAEKLLIDNIFDDVIDDHRTFVSMLTDTLMSQVSQSKNVYDYYGLTMAVGSLLSSLGSHYGKYSDNGIIDIALRELFRAVLECRCDNAILMVHMSQFLADISKDPQKTAVISNLCVNFPKKSIAEISLTFRHFQFPPEACLFQLFLTYLLTAFNSKQKLNSFELQLLMETLLNLNRVTSNVQEISHGVIKFLKRSQDTVAENVCDCLQQLTNATFTLNYLVLAHRNEKFTQLLPILGRERKKREEEFNEMKFHKYHSFMTELTKRGITLTSDLNRILEVYTDYPVIDLEFSNRLEQFWNYIRKGKCFDIEGKGESCITAYHLSDFEITALTAISLQPSIMENDLVDEDEAMNNEGSDEEDDNHFINVCREQIQLDLNPM